MLSISKLKKQTNKKPVLTPNKIEISQDEFDSILTNPNLLIVEKQFHSNLETHHVLYVIGENDIEYWVVKIINANGTEIYKEI